MVNGRQRKLFVVAELLSAFTFRHELLQLWFNWLHFDIHSLISLPAGPADPCTAAAPPTAAAAAAAAALSPTATQTADQFFLEQLGQQHGDGSICEHLQEAHFSPEQAAEAEKAPKTTSAALLRHLQDQLCRPAGINLHPLFMLKDVMHDSCLRTEKLFIHYITYFIMNQRKCVKSNLHVVLFYSEFLVTLIWFKLSINLGNWFDFQKSDLQGAPWRTEA